MKTLVVYDSLYGNTKAVAQAIGEALPGEVTVVHVGEASASGLNAHDLLVVGAPTHAGQAVAGCGKIPRSNPGAGSGGHQCGWL